MKFDIKEWIGYLFYLVIGFFAASSFLNSYIVNITSFSFVEFLFLPVLYLRRKEIRRGCSIAIRKDGGLLFISLIVLVALVAVGGVTSDGNVRGVLGGSRGYVYILFVGIYFRSNPLPGLYVLYALTLGALLGDLALMLKGTFYGEVFRTASDDVYKTNLMALYLCVSASILSRRVLLMLIVGAVSVIITVVGAFRINIAVMMIAILFGVLSSLKKVSVGGFFSLLIGLALASAVGFYTLGGLLNSGLLSKFGIFRIVDRTVALFSGDFYASQDMSRLHAFYYIVDDAVNCMIPRGMAVKNTGGIFNDLPLYEVFYVFSIPLVVLLIIFALYKTCSFYKCWLWGQLANQEDGLILGFSVLAILFLLANGRFLYIPYESIFYAMCIGRLFASGENLRSYQGRPQMNRHHRRY